MKFLHLLTGLFLVFVMAIAAPAQTTVQFTLDKSYTTSAGAYRPDGTLVRTLWRKRSYAAGTHSVMWDGKDDAGQPLPAGRYQVKVLYHNVQYIWDGAIGNTSLAQTGPRVHRGFLPIRDMVVNDTAVYYVMGYNEGQYNLHRFNRANSRTQTSLGRVDGFTAFSLVDSDGTWLYMANNEGGVLDGARTSFVYAVNMKDNTEQRFSAGQSVRLFQQWPDQYYASVIDLDQSGIANAPTGLAVQKNGRILAVAHRGLNVIRLFDKTSGQLLRTISANSPTSLSMAPNGDLWAIVGNTAVRYTNLDTAPAVANTIAGLTKPLALATDPTNDDMLLVADGGGSQQLKAFNRAGTPLWTFGQLGGYPVNGNEVRNDKFWFRPDRSDEPTLKTQESTFVTIAPDHSIWVGDGANNRCLHFSAERTFLEQLMYQPHTYAASVDAADPTRVFNGFLEFKVDYSKPIGDSWTLVRNWQAGVGDQYLAFFQGVRQVTTLPNGRTYAFIKDNNNRLELVELSGNRLRLTGIYPNGQYTDNLATLMPDGSLHLAPDVSNSGATATWQKRALTGFDAVGNPQWAAPVPLTSAPAGPQDPVPRCCGFGDRKTPLTSSGVLVSFDHSLNNGWHLGGLKPGGNGWLWKASPTGPLDGLGTFDIGNKVQYAGSSVVTSGRNIVYGYHGEFWKDAQAAQWMHFYDNGLFVGQFGETSFEHTPKEGVLAGFAGNGASPTLTTVNGETYLWVNDESAHGPQRWHLVGLQNVREAIGEGSLGSTILLSSAPVPFPTRVVASPGNGNIRLTWNGVAGANGYSVKYALKPGGPYTIAATDVAALDYTIQGLTNGTDYYVVVAAESGAGPGPNSEEVLAKPFDPNIPVHVTGNWQSNYTEFNVNSAAPNEGKPAMQIGPSLRYNANNMMLNDVGNQGYLIYNWGGVGIDNNNVKRPFAITTGASWKKDGYTKFRFRVDGQLGTDISLYSDPAGSVNITVGDNEWHYLTAFCAVRFDDPRNFAVTLTPQGQRAPAATYVVREFPGKNHVVQFRFKGNVTLTVDNQNGTGGTLQALFLDNAAVAATSSLPLPVELVGFTAERQGSDVQLRWATAQEKNNHRFDVESSIDGREFYPVGRLAGRGTATQRTEYQFTDRNAGRYASEQVYYRLRQVDVDSTAAYSPVRAVAVPAQAGLSIQAYPNPFHGELSVLIRTEQAAPATLTLTDAVGRTLLQRRVALTKGSTQIPLTELVGPLKLTPNVYVLRVQQGTQQQVLKLVYN